MPGVLLLEYHTHIHTSLSLTHSHSLWSHQYSNSIYSPLITQMKCPPVVPTQPCPHGPCHHHQWWQQHPAYYSMSPWDPHTTTSGGRNTQPTIPCPHGPLSPPPVVAATPSLLFHVHMVPVSGSCNSGWLVEEPQTVVSDTLPLRKAVTSMASTYLTPINKSTPIKPKGEGLDSPI